MSSHALPQQLTCDSPTRPQPDFRNEFLGEYVNLLKFGN